MNLNFSINHKDGKPTFFREKIWSSIDKLKLITEQQAIDFSEEQDVCFDLRYKDIPNLAPKIGTIRKKGKRNWKIGTPIYFFTGLRTKKACRFAPQMPVLQLQDIKIEYKNDHSDYPIVFIDKKIFYYYVKEDYFTLQNLAINDGFESVKDFFNYFSEDFTGKIIGWTNYKY